MIVADLETTGLDSRKHSILSIGAMDFENQENTFYGECRIRENSEIDEEALRVNGFTREKITTILMRDEVISPSTVARMIAMTRKSQIFRPKLAAPIPRIAKRAI